MVCRPNSKPISDSINEFVADGFGGVEVAYTGR